MSSPTSSFLATPPPTDSPVSPANGGFPPPPPPLVQQQPAIPAFERSPTRGHFGRNSRSSGVFRRIQRKEAFDNQQSSSPFNIFGVNPGPSNHHGFNTHSFGAPYKVTVS